MLQAALRDVLIRNPPLFDLAKRLDQLVRGVPNDSKLLHQIAQCAGFKEIVQIGANCGIRNDPVRTLVVKYKTKTLLVEPDPIAFKELKKSYAYLVKRGLDIRFVNAYVSPKDIDLRYYSLSPSGRRKVSKSRQVDLARKSGTDKNRLLEYLSSLGYKDAEDSVLLRSYSRLLVWKYEGSIERSILIWRQFLLRSGQAHLTLHLGLA